MQTKICTKCNKEKSINKFYTHKGGRFGVHSICKVCKRILNSDYVKANPEKHRIIMKAYYKTHIEKYKKRGKAYNKANKEKIRIESKKHYNANIEKIKSIQKTYRENNRAKLTTRKKNYRLANKEKISTYDKLYSKTNKEKIKAYSKKYRELNKEKISADGKNYRLANKDKINARYRENFKSNPKFKLNKCLSRAIRDSLGENKKGAHWEDLIGYTIEMLKNHLEKQFVNGMTWENHGKWHIDHIIPIAAFNFTKPTHTDFKKCWALKNLQPLWAKENIIKKDKLTKHFQPSLLL